MRVSDESGEIKMVSVPRVSLLLVLYSFVSCCHPQDLVAQGDGLRRDIVSSSDVFILGTVSSLLPCQT